MHLCACAHWNVSFCAVIAHRLVVHSNSTSARLAGTRESHLIYSSYLYTQLGHIIMPANLVDPANSRRTSGKDIPCCHKPENQKAVLLQSKPICFQFWFLDELKLTCVTIWIAQLTFSLSFFFFFFASCHEFLEIEVSLLLFRKQEGEFCTTSNLNSVLRRN